MGNWTWKNIHPTWGVAATTVTGLTKIRAHGIYPPNLCLLGWKKNINSIYESIYPSFRLFVTERSLRIEGIWSRCKRINSTQYAKAKRQICDYNSIRRCTPWIKQSDNETPLWLYLVCKQSTSKVDHQTTPDSRNECILIIVYLFESMYRRNWTHEIQTKDVWYPITRGSTCYPYFVWQWSSMQERIKFRIILE